MNEQGTHFWFMAFVGKNTSGLSVQERNGHWTPADDMTRFDAMNEVRRQVIEASPYLADAVLISFDIQPNSL
ncbi:hypothetical protein [Streptomyces sp. NRRL S-920]|uniref:hypothetical protein n=1 Tax=Streptomyces sp. NRRL S-920 TaxID=1463921 RepID=UPI0004C976BB|nr:hypothetical protein [Streptomyces sp. NRRL S-920]